MTPDGAQVARAAVEIAPYVAPRPGWAEQDPAVYWDALTLACRRLWQASAVASDAVAAVALTTQRGTVVNVDARGRPLRPAIVWLDQRRTAGVPPVGPFWRAALGVVGMGAAVRHVQAEAESHWIRRHQPDVWRATHRYLLLSGYLTWRLTGRWADSVGCQVGYLPFDYKRLRWAGARDWKWDAFGIDPALLPELVAPGTVIGALTREAAAALGVGRDVPLVAAAADKACEILGAGATRPGTAAISYGTTATVNVLLDRYAEAIPFMPAYPGPMPGRHALEVQIARGYWLVRWLLREFGANEGRLAEAEGVRPEVLFDRLVGEVPPGARGLLLQPYWAPGVREPGPEARGAVIGFSAEHGRAHVYRALLEGLAYGLREGAERIARGAGVSVGALCVAGGGAQSDVVLQLTADVFGRPASRPHLGDASALGAAIAAAVGAGLHADFDAAVARMTRLVRTCEPDARAARTYDRIYERVYRRMYARLQPLYEELHRLAERDG